MQSSRPTHQRYWLVFLLFLHTVNTYMDRVCISAAEGPMREDIADLDKQTMGYVFGIFAIGYALFQIPAGWFSDRAGPRRALTIVVVIWSVFTALTGAVTTAISLLVVRFLFGVGEAGAYPGATRALYRWLPAKERGLGQGIFHSGARVGAAASLLVMPWLIGLIGWRMTFVANALLGLVWGGVWWVWYRNEPTEHSKVNAGEAELIRAGLEEEAEAVASTDRLPYVQIVTSKNVLLAMFQYAASNITFFFSISWLQPYLKETWGDDAAPLASIPLLVGAVALWVSGFSVTRLHRLGFPVLSRRLPAMIGYSLGAIGLLLCTQTNSAVGFIACYSLAMFGVEMTLSPSWAFCMDIGGSRSGAVSAAMNMVGNLGAAVSAIAVPYFMKYVLIPVIAPEAGTANSFFVFAATMNGLAVVAWLFMNPQRQLEQISKVALQVRLALFVLLLATVVTLLVYTKFLMPKDDSGDAEEQETAQRSPARVVTLSTTTPSPFALDAEARLG